LVISPTSHVRLSWDVLSFVAVTWDLVMLPLQVFELPPYFFLYVMQIAIAVFWTTDIFFSFMTGYYDSGLVEMRPKRIACKYMRRTLIPDLCVVSVEWFDIMFAVDTAEMVSLARATKFVRVMRVIRMLSVVRIVRVLSIFDAISGTLSDELRVVLEAVKMLVVVGFATHFLACLWYFIGSRGGDRGWVHRFEVEKGSDNQLYRYLASFQWVLAQLTPAPAPVDAGNMHEQLYSVCVLFFGISAFSSFLSTAASKISSLRESTLKNVKRHEDFRRYLHMSNVSRQLSFQASHYLRDHRGTSECVAWQDVRELEMLPKRLLINLRYEVFANAFVAHPLFLFLNYFHRTTLLQICMEGASEQIWQSDDDLFVAGSISNEMLFIRSGSICITNDDNLPGVDSETWLSKRAWICEACLWMQWIHQFSAKVGKTEAGIVMAVHSSSFSKIVLTHPVARQKIRAYAIDWFKLFQHLWCHNTGHDHCLDFNDLKDLVVDIFGALPSNASFFFY